MHNHRAMMAVVSMVKVMIEMDLWWAAIASTVVIAVTKTWVSSSVVIDEVIFACKYKLINFDIRNGFWIWIGTKPKSLLSTSGWPLGRCPFKKGPTLFTEALSFSECIAKCLIHHHHQKPSSCTFFLCMQYASHHCRFHFVLKNLFLCVMSPNVAGLTQITKNLATPVL